MKKYVKFFIIVLCIALIAAIVLYTKGFFSKDQSSSETKTFTFLVTDAEGQDTSYVISSSENTVGNALVDEGLISGDDGPYGLYVKTVCGITADYDIDGSYWAFYINGNLAPSSVDSTNIQDGFTYSFKIEK